MNIPGVLISRNSHFVQGDRKVNNYSKMWCVITWEWVQCLKQHGRMCRGHCIQDAVERSDAGNVRKMKAGLVVDWCAVSLEVADLQRKKMLSWKIRCVWYSRLALWARRRELCLLHPGSLIQCSHLNTNIIHYFTLALPLSFSGSEDFCLLMSTGKESMIRVSQGSCHEKWIEIMEGCKTRSRDCCYMESDFWFNFGRCFHESPSPPSNESAGMLQKEPESLWMINGEGNPNILPWFTWSFPSDWIVYYISGINNSNKSYSCKAFQMNHLIESF